MLSNKLILIGEVVRAQGIKGKLKVRPLADLDIFASLKGVYLGKGEETSVYYKVVSSQVHKRAVLLALDGIETMTMAEELIGNRIFAEPGMLEELPEGEYYWSQIIGLDVFTEDGQRLGRVEEIFPTGSNDVYVVREGTKEYLIPAIAEVVKDINVAGGRMIISPMKGLLGEE
ncbi:MAG: ribosome maturation factor RimM [Deltaproteobacteria bacterium]|nr:ribosome maturation factor RimM [Deltaproteobacteria bacterium]